MAHIRTLKELTALGLTPAEENLLVACKAGVSCQLGDGTVPPEDPPSHGREIRANVLRYLIFGGCEACTIEGGGIDLKGAYVTGPLNLNFKAVAGQIALEKCRFDTRVDMLTSKFGRLQFDGSHMKGMRCESSDIAGDVFLDDVVSTEQISFKGTEVKGQFTCLRAQLAAKSDYALDLQLTHIRGLVQLHVETESIYDTPDTFFTAHGGIRLLRASIGGLYAQCIHVQATGMRPAIAASDLKVWSKIKLGNATVEGEVKMTGAEINGDLDCEGAAFRNDGAAAFDGRRLHVSKSLIWKQVKTFEGAVNLTGAHIAELDDDPANWPQIPDALQLDGFIYDRIRGEISSTPARDLWLRNGSINKGLFYPQPYTQYAKFLRETGHDAQARDVLYTREALLLASERKDLGWLSWAIRVPFDWLTRVVVGYGHKPFRSLLWLLGLLAVTWVFAQMAWDEGAFAPNSGPILISHDWKDLQMSQNNPGQVWSGIAPPLTGTGMPNATNWAARAPGRDWETFNSFAYAADVVIPLIDFGQTKAWSPSTSRGPWGHFLWWAKWGFSVAGWIVTALGAAAITGIIRRD